MVKEMYDKKKLTILRAVLIAVGAAVGGTAVWQYFVVYPDVLRREAQIGVIIVSAAALAALLGLSAKPFYRLGASIGGVFKNMFARLGAAGIIATASGLIAAGLLCYVFDVIIRDSIGVIAVRVLADILVFSLLAALGIFGFTKWISASVDEDAPPPTRGYMLTASCFFDDRVFVAAQVFDRVRVSEGAFRALWKSGEGVNLMALERFKAVAESGAVHTVKCDKDFSSVAEYLEYERELCSELRLKSVALALDGFEFPLGATSLEIFAPDPDARKKFFESFANGVQNADEAECDGATGIKSGEPAQEDDANGQIIIDK